MGLDEERIWAILAIADYLFDCANMLLNRVEAFCCYWNLQAWR
jgi:hypothetical protein